MSEHKKIPMILTYARESKKNCRCKNPHTRHKDGFRWGDRGSMPGAHNVHHIVSKREL